MCLYCRGICHVVDGGAVKIFDNVFPLERELVGAAICLLCFQETVVGAALETET